LGGIAFIGSVNTCNWRVCQHVSPASFAFAAIIAGVKIKVSYSQSESVLNGGKCLLKRVEQHSSEIQFKLWQGQTI